MSSEHKDETIRRLFREQRLRDEESTPAFEAILAAKEKQSRKRTLQLKQKKQSLRHRQQNQNSSMRKTLLLHPIQIRSSIPRRRRQIQELLSMI